MAIQVGMTFLGRNHKTLGIQKLHNFSVSFDSTYMVGVQRNGSGAMSGTATDFSKFSKIRLEGRRGDPIH